MWAEVSEARRIIGVNVGVFPDSMAYVGGGYDATLERLVRSRATPRRARSPRESSRIRPPLRLRVVRIGVHDDVVTLAAASSSRVSRRSRRGWRRVGQVARGWLVGRSRGRRRATRRPSARRVGYDRCHGHAPPDRRDHRRPRRHLRFGAARRLAGQVQPRRVRTSGRCQEDPGAPRLRGIPSTWFVPGHTLTTFVDDTDAILAGGHELACHGWFHEDFAELADDEAAAVLARSVEAARAVTGARRPGSARRTGRSGRRRSA